MSQTRTRSRRCTEMAKSKLKHVCRRCGKGFERATEHAAHLTLEHATRYVPKKERWKGRVLICGKCLMDMETVDDGERRVCPHCGFSLAIDDQHKRT